MHPSIKNGDIDSTPAHVFRAHFTQNLRDFLDFSPGSIVLLVPSIRDIINDHAVFPQREFDTVFSGDPVSTSAFHQHQTHHVNSAIAHSPSTKSMPIRIEQCLFRSL
jgi:hypothetical protein